jgi:hypothetical protein
MIQTANLAKRLEFLSMRFFHRKKMLHCGLSTHAAKHGRNIRYRSDLRLLVAVLARYYRVLIRKFL